MWPAAEPLPPEQIWAALKGSEAAMLAAQHAAIGAKICTVRAIRTIGRNFRSRRRIDEPTSSKLLINHAGSPESRQGCLRYDARQNSSPRNGEITRYLRGYGATLSFAMASKLLAFNMPKVKQLDRMQPKVSNHAIISQIARILNNRCRK
jgi:hypothetical protein